MDAKRIDDYVNRINKLVIGVSVVFLVSTIGIVITNVLSRYVLHVSLTWSAEAARYSMIWSALLAAAVLVNRSQHLRVDFLDQFLSRRARFLLLVLVEIGSMTFFVVMSISGSILVLRTSGQIASSIESLPMNAVYLIIPISAATDAVRLIHRAAADPHREEGDRLTTLLLVSFFVFLVLRFPIAVALGLSCVVGLSYDPMAPAVVVAQRMFVSLDSFPLMAVPLYMLAGYLMSAGGISRRIVEFSSALVGNLAGGLAHVNILASMIFGGISGSAVADTAGIGNIMIPEMKNQGYDKAYSAAITAVSSTLGIVIPPSIPMVIIGAMLGVSVGKLFLGGVIPGLLIGLGLHVRRIRVGEDTGDRLEACAATRHASVEKLSPSLLGALDACDRYCRHRCRNLHADGSRGRGCRVRTCCRDADLPRVVAPRLRRRADEYGTCDGQSVFPDRYGGTSIPGC